MTQRGWGSAPWAGFPWGGVSAPSNPAGSIAMITAYAPLAGRWISSGPSGTTYYPLGTFTAV